VYLWASMATYMIGMADETVQWMLPGRVGEFRDVLLNGLCGALGLGLTAVVLQRPSPPEARPCKRWRSLGTGAAIVLIASLLFRSLTGR